jgi:hypothetical protein
MCRHESDPQPENGSQSQAGPGRRAFLWTAGAGAGAAALASLGAGRASAAEATPASSADGVGRWAPDTEGLQFTLAVMPDTQFLYWGSQGSINPEPQEESFRYIINNSSRPNSNIVFMAHLGDLTEDAQASSFHYVSQAFDILDNHGVAYSVLAGNHDVSGDDTRGSTPYLQAMGPQRFRKSPTFVGSDASGYNTAHIFRAAGREWLLLALDWRMSAAGFAWANQTIKDHPSLPVIVTTHEIVGTPYDDNVYPYPAGDPNNDAVFSGYGQSVWDGLIKDNDQIFLTLNGHYWPPGRMTMQNSAGNDVQLHIANYQNRYFGGAAMLRLYHFDLARNIIDVETVSPWILAQPPEERTVLAAAEARLTTAVDYFSMPIDFDQRFSGFAPIPGRPGRPPKEMVIPGTLAYWRFDSGNADGSPVTASQVIPDLSGHGNDLNTLVTVPGSPSDSLTWSSDFHPDQPGHGSLYFNGNGNPLQGAYLTTGAKAPLNSETFPSGFTIEAFIKLPLDWDSGDHAWSSAFSRQGTAGQAGKNGPGSTAQEPIATLSISSLREFQWNSYPPNLNGPTTNWSQGLYEDVWWHVALVNDGKHTVMYVEASPTVDNPTLIQSNGITALGLPWSLGGYDWNGATSQVFHGFIGDVRIVNRPLSVSEFMIAK